MNLLTLCACGTVLPRNKVVVASALAVGASAIRDRQWRCHLPSGVGLFVTTVTALAPGQSQLKERKKGARRSESWLMFEVKCSGNT